MTKPPKYKMAIIVWIAIYPTINLVFWLAGEYLVQLPLLLRTLFLTIVLVSLMVFVLIPILTKVFGKWLHGPALADQPRDVRKI